MNRFEGINITNISGVTVIGNNNIVRNEFKDIYQMLEQLEHKTKITSEISEDKKLEAFADINTIKEQLSKPLPDKNIIRSAMQGIAFLGSIPGVFDLYNMIKHAVEKLF